MLIRQLSWFVRLQGSNPVTITAPNLVVPDYARVFRCAAATYACTLSELKPKALPGKPAAIAKRRAEQGLDWRVCTTIQPAALLTCSDGVECASYPGSYVAQDVVTSRRSEERWVNVLIRSPEYWSSIKQNKAPLPVPNFFTIDQGSSLTVVLNATDDYDQKEQLSFSISGAPLGGVTTLKDRWVATYTPDPGFWGLDEFTFRVEDGMELSAEATISIEVVHINSVPRPVCEDANSGLLQDHSLIAALRALAGSPSAAAAEDGVDTPDVDRNATVELLVAEMGAAVIGDRFSRSLRTQALRRLASYAQAGAIIGAGGGQYYDLACSVAGSWELDMTVPEGAPEGAHWLDVSLAAFDRDEEDSITYTIMQAPQHGTIFGSTGLLDTDYTQGVRASDCHTSHLPHWLPPPPPPFSILDT